MNQKTKATPKDRQWNRTKPGQFNPCLAGGLEKIRRPQIEEVGEYQPFGSMPRCCNSLRSMRFIQVANDESPSLRISSSSWARNSSGNRIWYCGDFFSSCIDTCNYPYYYLYGVITRVITFILKSNEVPQVVTTLAGLLTTTDNRSIEVAMKNHTTQSQIVYLPLVDAVDTGAPREWQLMQQTEINLLYRVKRALDRAGVEWIDTRTGETSPLKTDNAEGCDNAQ